MGHATGILRMSAIDRIAQRIDSPFRLAVQCYAAQQLAVHRRGLLAVAQIFQRRGPLLRRDPVGDAAAGAAEIEPEHEAGPFRRAAMIERIDAQRTVHAEDMRRNVLDEFETRPPDQRAITEDPEVFGGMIEGGGWGVHCGRRLAYQAICCAAMVWTAAAGRLDTAHL